MAHVELSVVFYDLTTIRTEGLSEQDGDVRQYGMSKEGLIARQFMLGVVQTADGMPIYHEVFAGNTSEAPTLQPTLCKVLARLPHIRRLIVVADRGLLSLDNIEALSQIEVATGQPLEFILAVPARRYADFEDILQPLQDQATQTTQEFVSEARWQGHRLVVAHHPEREGNPPGQCKSYQESDHPEGNGDVLADDTPRRNAQIVGTQKIF